MLTTLLLVGSAVAEAQESVRVQVDNLAKPYIDNEIVMGMTIGILHDAHEEYFGYGRLGKSDERVPDENTIYEIGSTSKVFTGLLLADAVVQGRVQLEQAAGDLLPKDVTMPANGKRPITLKDLSTHVSGLPRLPDNLKMTNPENPYADYTTPDLHAFLNNHKLARAPGKKFEYSNLGVGLLGHLLALQQNTTYEQLLRDRITVPFGMESTTISLSEQQRSRLAPPHLDGGLLTSRWDLPAIAGGGGIRSSAKDILRLAKANLSPPTGKMGDAIELAWRIHQQALTKGDRAMGLGWAIDEDGKTRMHNGQTGGYHSIVLVNRDNQTSVVVLANTATTEVDKLAQDVMRLLAGKNVQPRKFEKTVKVLPTVMQRYVGRYELAPGVVFTVASQDGILTVGLTGQPAHRVYAKSDTEWYYKVVPATLTFEVNDDGKCIAVELFQNGAKIKAKRMDE